MATFYIVATPIGNLSDITLRAIEVLRSVDLILAEDTRTAKKLLSHYQIKTPVASYHQRSRIKKIDYFIFLLEKGKNLALISEAGTPGISDPGTFLIKEITERLGEKVKISPLPGPSALTAILSVADFDVSRFFFLGFFPKKKRKKLFEEVLNFKRPFVFYESPYRILKTLRELDFYWREIYAEKSEPKVVLGRELTKKFETIYRGGLKKVIGEIEKGEIRGEFVVLVSGPYKNKKA